VAVLKLLVAPCYCKSLSPRYNFFVYTLFFICHSGPNFYFCTHRRNFRKLFLSHYLLLRNVIYYFECRLYHINMEFTEQVGGWLVCLISVLVMPFCIACGWPHLPINKSQVPYFTRFTKLSDQPQVFQWQKYADVVYMHLEEATFSVIPTHTHTHIQAFYIVWCKNETSTVAFDLLGEVPLKV